MPPSSRVAAPPPRSRPNSCRSARSTTAPSGSSIAATHAAARPALARDAAPLAGSRGRQPRQSQSPPPHRDRVRLRRREQPAPSRSRGCRRLPPRRHHRHRGHRGAVGVTHHAAAAARRQRPPHRLRPRRGTGGAASRAHPPGAPRGRGRPGAQHPGAGRAARRLQDEPGRATLAPSRAAVPAARCAVRGAWRARRLRARRTVSRR